MFLEALWTECSTGVQYIETRKTGAQQLYSLDTHRKYEPTYGKRYLDPSGELEINMALLLLREFQKTRPDFIGFRRIIYGHHRESVSQIKAKVCKCILLPLNVFTSRLTALYRYIISNLFIAIISIGIAIIIIIVYRTM